MDSTGSGRPRTIAFVHAHPDDEALLTAGTMAKAHDAGHRVILVMATDGAAGLTSSELAADLAARRADELAASALALGVDEVINLGYADSGLTGDSPGGFAHASPEALATDVAEMLDSREVDIVVGYDPSGGYGHPDHLQVHHVVRRAVGQMKRPVTLFEATLPREPIRDAVHAASRIRLTPSGFDPSEFDDAWTPKANITHRINVRKFMRQKMAALSAHASQAQSDSSTRTLGVLTKLPMPLATALLGTEYYVKVDPTAFTNESAS
jgi:LmbE family N-acetylglucosaminyl deacetylase